MFKALLRCFGSRLGDIHLFDEATERVGAPRCGQANVRDSMLEAPAVGPRPSRHGVAEPGPCPWSSEDLTGVSWRLSWRLRPSRPVGVSFGLEAVTDASCLNIFFQEVAFALPDGKKLLKEHRSL